MDRLACVDLPALPLQILLQQHPDWVGHPAVVVAEDRPPHPNAVDIWCSQKDISRLIQCCIDAPEEKRFGIFFGLSESKKRWCDLENAREIVGYVPEDCGEDFL